MHDFTREAIHILSVEDGEIVVRHCDDNWVAGNGTIFKSDSAMEVAKYLDRNGIETWWNSSSMDFSKEYGWPSESAAADLKMACNQIAKDNRAVTMVYTNWKGETKLRKIVPYSIRYGTTKWHPEPGWLMRAHDLDKDEVREFSLGDCDFRRF